MKNMSPFCTCTNFDCPMHPTKHERGCAPCIAKNLKLREIPTCFFNLVDRDGARADDKFADFAKCVLNGGDEMQITNASPAEYPEIRLFYHALIDAMQERAYHPGWKKDIYPAPEELRAALASGTLYTGRAGGQLAAAMVVNDRCNDEYRNAAWPLALARGEFMVIHMLGVHPDFAGRGYAKQMVRYAIELARAAGMRAVRLDVLEGNLPAERLYPALGFSYVETIPMFYEDTGWKNYLLYELAL